MPEDLERAMPSTRSRSKRRKCGQSRLAGSGESAARRRSQPSCANFNGYGDEGSIESIQFLDTDSQPVVLKEQFPKLEPTFWPLLPCGFEDNDGSSGTVCLDVEQGRIVVDIDWNVTATETSTTRCNMAIPSSTPSPRPASLVGRWETTWLCIAGLTSRKPTSRTSGTGRCCITPPGSFWPNKCSEPAS